MVDWTRATGLLSGSGLVGCRTVVVWMRVVLIVSERLEPYAYGLLDRVSSVSV